MSMTYSPFEINYMEYLKSIISTSCHIIVSYYIVKADYMVPKWYQSITNIVFTSSNMIAQGIIFYTTIKGNYYDRLVSINIISLSLSYRRFINNRKEARHISRKMIRCVLLENGEIILISFTEEERRPLCAYPCKFASEIGVVVRLILDHLFFAMEMTNCDHLISSYKYLNYV